MSEPAVDVDSKTSLFKRWWALFVADADKAMRAYTSPMNWAFMALSMWMYIAPYFENRGAVQANAQVTSLGQMIGLKDETIKQLNSDLNANKTGFEAVKQDAAKLALDLDACRADPPAKEIDKATKQEAALTPPVTKIKVRKVPTTKPVDPTLYEQFVAWYEKNVDTGPAGPGVN